MSSERSVSASCSLCIETFVFNFSDKQPAAKHFLLRHFWHWLTDLSCCCCSLPSLTRFMQVEICLTLNFAVNISAMFTMFNINQCCNQMSSPQKSPRGVKMATWRFWDAEGVNSLLPRRQSHRRKGKVHFFGNAFYATTVMRRDILILKIIIMIRMNFSVAWLCFSFLQWVAALDTRQQVLFWVA